MIRIWAPSKAEILQKRVNQFNPQKMEKLTAENNGDSPRAI
jgi:hypothetical protein